MSKDDFFHSYIYRNIYLHEKSTKVSPKILLLTRYWVTSQYFHQLSVKNPKLKLFFSRLFGPWIDVILWNLHPQEALAQRIKQSAWYQIRVLKRKSKAHTALASSWTCLQRSILQKNGKTEIFCFNHVYGS